MLKTLPFSRRHLPLALVFLAFNLSCKPALSPAETELNQMNWLSGTWVKQIDSTKTIEIWEKQKDHSYRVTGAVIAGSDTLFSEKILVKPTGSDITYQVYLGGQEKNAPVIFKLIQNTGSAVVFENAQHDFPQKISYRQVGADSVYIQLTGMVKGKPATEAFALKRL